MKRLIAGSLAAWLVGIAGGFGPHLAAGDPGFGWMPPVPAPVGDASTTKVVYAVGGARPPGLDWAYYTNKSGDRFFPGAKREIIDYPAGAMFSWVPTFVLPGPRDNTTIGNAANIAVDNLDKALHRTGTDQAAAVGLSQGGLAMDTEQARLANDPTAPPPDRLTFTTFGDPSGTNGFGTSFLASFFKPGDHIPIVDYTMPQRPDSQYNSNRVFAAYDGFADFPDRMDNLPALLNGAFGAGISHTPAAFVAPEQIPPQNIRTTVNSRGATETTYMIPVNHLPLTLPLRFLGWPDAKVDQIDAVLAPQIDAAYAYNDNPAAKPISIDPVHGMDPLERVDPGFRDSLLNAFAQLRAILPPPPA